MSFWICHKFSFKNKNSSKNNLWHVFNCRIQFHVFNIYVGVSNFILLGWAYKLQIPINT